MCKRHRSEPAGSLLAIYRKPLLARRSEPYVAKEATMHETLLLATP
jgi:hypothetical protein